ncbi:MULTISPECIES: amidohydrolase [Streptomyces]|uniref:Amidohydrolase 3 n=1 Tax=Streptomyces venezuelae (strain ATCC 10712 / CBS 650.69 / DSM 40230 / JCM 4526 / NBRC 13096 / PD 04745) TaxID=953739 RepID=F2RJH4_STRVP|nr:amidohydrolase [Streptomyces venezuelae]APE21198.1 amidohydrolase [Streptomyces venezuelae]QER98586.1 amidohydrolase [Streptomyces venezuelae ATCC 10712]QES05788.1 amidohydrolase [Streptomyces venezuelae]CCA55184.1 amidohydrolase 3 [Streptomyces venezuelae ATCC 10712]
MSAPDLVLVNGRVRDPELTGATAVAVRDGLITALGDTTDARGWRGPGTEVVDLGGATLTPGLTDAHSHPVWGLEMFTGTDLSGVTDLEGLREALRTAERRDGWITGFGLDHNVFGGRPVHHDLIEDVLDGAPAHLRLYDGHSALVSATALKAAGITGPRAFAQLSEVVCDADGRPTGHLVEHAAMDLMTPVLPAQPYAERRDRLVELLTAMAATGLTSAHVMDLGGHDVPGLLTALEEDGELPLRLRLAPWCMPGVGEEELDGLVRLQGRAGRLWAVGGVKFFMDGTVEGGTAWLEHADCHGRGTDAFWPDPAAYSAAVGRLHRAGVGTATHAIGDAAVRHVLDTVEGLGTGGPRHRIEHIETVPDDQLGRFAALGVVASMQPPHTAYTRADHTDEWSRRLGEERAARAWRCRDLRDAGAHLALGSDWPIAHFDARQVLATARAPRGAASARHGLTGLMALEGMTTHAAVAAGEERFAGRIAPGYRADLTAFAVDPVEAPADETGQAPIRLTVAGGRITFRS